MLLCVFVFMFCVLSCLLVKLTCWPLMPIKILNLETICHQVRCLRWWDPSLFHTATSLFIWYKMFHVRDISYRLIWMKFINMLSVYAQSGTHRRFNWWIIAALPFLEPFCSDVCGDHRRPQTLAEICINVGICCGFRAVAARGKYPGFILLLINPLNLLMVYPNSVNKRGLRLLQLLHGATFTNKV